MKKIFRMIIWILIGIGVGMLTGYLRAYNPASFWAFSDIAGRYGFWIFTVSLIAYFAENKKAARINSFVYMFCMCLAYYGYLYDVKGFLYVKQFIFWCIFAVIAAGYAMLIRDAKNHQRRRDRVICVIPLSLLAIEFMEMLYFFARSQTNFFQLIVDFAGAVVLGILFLRKRQNKYKFMVLGSTFLITAIVCVIFWILWL